MGLSKATKFRKTILLLHYEYFINEIDVKHSVLKSGFGNKLKQI